MQANSGWVYSRSIRGASMKPSFRPNVYKAGAEQNIVVVELHVRTVGPAGGYLMGFGRFAFTYSQACLAPVCLTLPMRQQSVIMIF